jgi:hypothetical protein
MRKVLLTLFTVATLGFSSESFSQGTNLYVGSQYSSTLTVYDTTGATYTSLTTVDLSGGSSGTINGCFSLSLKPSTQEMYIVYDDGSGPENRRLGVVDTVSGAIADIGNAGNLTDIAFYGDELFGTTGDYTGYNFVRVNQMDGSLTTLFGHSPSGDGNCLWWNTFTGESLYKHTEGGGAFTEIDTTTMTETTLITSSPGYYQAAAMKNDSIALIISAWSGDLYEVNMNTLDWTFITSLESSHAMAFNLFPLYVIVDGPAVFCDNESTTVLASSESASDFQWFLDGVSIDGATDSTFVPMESGLYSCSVDGDQTNPVMITVLEAPTASFDATPNPVDLGIDPSGIVTFVNTSTGGNQYLWDFDGIVTPLENTTYPFGTVGTYDVMFIVTDDATGCSDTATTSIEVISSVGLDQLSSEFSIYPLPTEDFVTISATNGNGNYQVQLMDLQGRVLENKALSGSQTTFDLSQRESGVYLVKIFDEKEEGYFKVVRR